MNTIFFRHSNCPSMSFKHIRILIYLVILLNYSCTSYKNVPYYQDVKRNSTSSEKIVNYSPLIMQPGDLLGFNVVSLNHDADLIFNYNLRSDAGNLDRAQQGTVVGYLIDQDGNINMPMLGLVKVSGYTTKEISTLLALKLETYLSKPVVNVRILNFKISVLGDVTSPGSFSIQNEKVTINEALSLAGDLTITALRNNVLLIREKDGERSYINIDLTTKSTFNSPYYYLKNNDILYVQPSRTKLVNQDGTFQRIGIIFSALTILVYLLRNSKF